jgi:hypothetical protein
MDAGSLYRLGDMQELLGSIRHKTRFGEAAFVRDCLPVIDAFAELVQMFPTDPSVSASERRTVLRLALKTCDIALQLRQAELLPRRTATEEVHCREHRWTYGVLVAALLNDLGHSLCRLRIQYSDRDGRGMLWHPLAGTLRECSATCYRVLPMTVESGCSSIAERLAIAFLLKLVQQPVLHWLTEDSELTEELTDFLTGLDTPPGTIARLVLRAKKEAEPPERSEARHAPLRVTSDTPQADALRTPQEPSFKDANQYPPPMWKAIEAIDSRTQAAACQANLFPTDQVAELSHSERAVSDASIELRPGLRIKSPISLSPVVRTALDRLEVDINRASRECMCHLDETGLFVAFDEFQRLGIDTATAVKCLDAVGMLHLGGASKQNRLYTRTFAGRDVRGVVLCREVVYERGHNASSSETTEPVCKPPSGFTR